MTVKLRLARGTRAGFEYDILGRWPGGERFRERANVPLTGSSKTGALRWAQAREAAILGMGSAAYAARNTPPPDPAAGAPTLAAFWPRVVSEHYRANRKKPSTIDAAEAIYRGHLDGFLGAMPLDTIGAVDVARIKARLNYAAPKTVNNVLSVLSRAMRCAVEWGVIATRPAMGLLAITDSERAWYELAEYRRLMAAARALGPAWTVLVLLAGSAGLRRGEIRALTWGDVDLAAKVVRVRRATWRAIEGTTKGNRPREVPLTDELAGALRAHAPAGAAQGRVLYSLKGRPLSNRTIRNWMARVQRRAGVLANGGIHLLRHTFCSHLAAAGVPALAIKELAGHRDLKTTLKYMHLAPNDRGAAMVTLTNYYGTKKEEKRKSA